MIKEEVKMTVKTKVGARVRPHYGVTSPVTWVWGDKKKGASVFRVTAKSVLSHKPIASWSVYLWSDSRVVYKQVDYPTKAEAVGYAKSLQKRYRAYAG